MGSFFRGSAAFMLLTVLLLSGCAHKRQSAGCGEGCCAAGGCDMTYTSQSTLHSGGASMTPQYQAAPQYHQAPQQQPWSTPQPAPQAPPPPAPPIYEGH